MSDDERIKRLTELARRCKVCAALAFWREDERAWLCAACWGSPALRPQRAKMRERLEDALGIDLRAKGGDRG